MILLLRQQAVLGLLAALVFFTNLGNYALLNDAESKSASCAAEMQRRGDLFIPTFNEEIRAEQPILSYWLMFVSYRFFGISEFSARLPSAIMALGTTLLTYHLGRKLYSIPVGFLSGIILCSCLAFSGDGRSATSDSMMTFFVTLAFAGYVWVVAKQRGGNFCGDETANSELSLPQSELTQPTNPETAIDSHAIHSAIKQLVPPTWPFSVPIFAAMGFAVLTKGPAGFLLPSGIIALFLLIAIRSEDLDNGTLPPSDGAWWQRWIRAAAQLFRHREILEVGRGMNFPIGVTIVAAIALPWYLIVGFMTGGNWIREFLIEHNLSYAFIARENQTGFPLYPFYYVVAIHLCCFPWSVFLLGAVYQLRLRLSDGAAWRDSDRLLACWAGVWFVVFSIVSTKSSSNLLPMYPAVALLLARYFFDWEREEAGVGVYSFSLCLRAMGIAGAALCLGLYVAAYLFFSTDLTSAQWIGLIGLVPVAGAFVATKFLDLEQRKRVLQTLVATAVLLAFLLVAIAPASLSPYQDSKLFVTEARRIAGTSDIEIATYGYFDANVVFYAGKKVRRLDSPRQAADFIAGHPHAFIIAKASQHNELRNELLDDVRELARHRRFLIREEMILLGRN